MKKFYSCTFVYFAVFCCVHFNIFAKTTDDQPIVLKPTPVKALPVRFKPLPFKPLYLTKVDLYQFDQKAYVFGKITSAFPVLSAQEWQTVSNDPVRFTLTPNKPSAYVGEEVELTLTAELLNISPSALFTFEELREYTIKVVLPNDFIQTGGTYYDFLKDKLDIGNPKKTYTIKGRYLAKPALDDCFKVLRKLNNEVFILKATQCPNITEVDIASMNNTPVIADSLKKTREIAAIDLSKINYLYSLTSTEGNKKVLLENELNVKFNCLEWKDYLLETSIGNTGVIEIINNNAAVYWEMIQKEGDIIIETRTLCSSQTITWPIRILDRTTSITSTLKVYSTNVCPTGSTVPSSSITPLQTKSITYTIDRSPCPPPSFTITASSTTICSGNSATLEASGNCPSANVSWRKNDAPYGSNGSSLIVSEAGNYKAVCSSPALTSNTIGISVSTTPPAPTVTTDKNTLTPGEFAQLTASNCSGIVLWTGPNNFADVGNQISVNKSGGYNAKCKTTCIQNNVATDYYSGLSATINISVAPLRLQADKSQIRPGESVTLTAYGCTNGYIKWKINDNLQPSTDNPFTFNSSGFYSASCNSWDGTYTSEWVTVFIHQLPANTPTVTANKLRAYNNESVILTASGCSTYYWVIPVRQPNGTYVTTTPYPTGNPKTVTGPANYQVGCTNQGPWTSVTVYQLQPGDITLTSNKTVANTGEAVELTITGDCPSNAGIQWKIMGQYSWTTRYESKTVYGPGTYEARCIIDDYSYGNWTSKRINAPAPGGITISTSKTSAGSTELVTLRANGCDGEVVWTLPGNTEVRGTSILFATGPGTYKAKCVRFGINGEPATIVIQTKPNDAPRFYATQSTASGNQIFELVAENCPNNYVQWGIPKQDANGNTYYDYANFFPTLIVRGPGTYQVRCNEGNHTDFQDIVVFPNPSDALTIVANKSKVLPTESVTLTAFGCPNGVVKWEIGSSIITGVQYTTYGPGTYKARCIGDPTNNGDYAVATIIPNGSIVPSLSASQNTACPNESVTVTASSGSCPAGWPFQWQLVKDGMVDYWLNNRNAIENFGENYGNVFEIKSGTSLTRSGPRIYYVRCLKPDLTWIGEFKDKSFIVEPVFPEYLRASNNGPALMGATGIKVAVTEVPGPNITYTWAGPGGFTSSSRSADVTGLTEAKSGVYTVTVRKTAPVACSVTATTKLVVSDCNVKIKASNPSNGQETYVLPYSNESFDNYNDLALEAIRNDGTPPQDVTYTWTKPDGTTTTTSYLLTRKPGKYSLKISPINNPNVGCRTFTTISGDTPYKLLLTKTKSRTFTDGTPVKVVPIQYEEMYYVLERNGVGEKIDIAENYLLFYTSNNVKKVDMMQMIPTYQYSQTHTAIDESDFTGLILFTEKDGKTFKKGWRFNNGGVSKAITASDISQARVKAPNDDCVLRLVITTLPQGLSLNNNTNEIEGGTAGGDTWTAQNEPIVKSFPLFNFDCCLASPTGCSSGDNPTSPDPPFTPGGGSTPPAEPSDIAKKLCDNYVTLLGEANNVAPKAGIVNTDCSYDQAAAARFSVYAKIMDEAVKKEFAKDPALQPYINKMIPPTEAQINSAASSYYGSAGENNKDISGLLAAGCMLTQNFLADTQHPINADQEDKISNALKYASNDIKATYNALIKFINPCNTAQNCSAPNTPGLAVMNAIITSLKNRKGGAINGIIWSDMGDRLGMEAGDIKNTFNDIVATGGLAPYTDPGNPNVILSQPLNGPFATIKFKYDTKNNQLDITICDNTISLMDATVPPPVNDCSVPNGGRLTENPVYPFVKEWMLNSLDERGNSIQSMSMVNCSSCTLTNMGNWGAEWGGRTYWLFKNNNGDHYWITREIGTTNYAYAYDADPTSNAGDHLTFTSWEPDFGEESTPGAKFSQYTANTFASAIGVIVATPVIVSSVIPVITNGVTLGTVIEEVITNTLLALATDGGITPATLAKETVDGVFTDKLIEKVPALLGRKFQVPVQVFNQIKKWLLQKGNTPVTLSWLQTVRITAKPLIDKVANFTKNAWEGVDKLCNSAINKLRLIIDDIYIKSLTGANGLIGAQYENWLALKLKNASGTFTLGGREFDGAYNNGKIWFEAKSGNYWTTQTNTPEKLAKFKSDMGSRLKLASDNGKSYELFSNTPIPQNIKDWLTSKGIIFHETLN